MNLTLDYYDKEIEAIRTDISSKIEILEKAIEDKKKLLMGPAIYVMEYDYSVQSKEAYSRHYPREDKITAHFERGFFSKLSCKIPIDFNLSHKIVKIIEFLRNNEIDIIEALYFKCKGTGEIK